MNSRSPEQLHPPKHTATNKEIRGYQGKVYQSTAIMRQSVTAEELKAVGDSSERAGINLPKEEWNKLPLAKRP